MIGFYLDVPEFVSVIGVEGINSLTKEDSEIKKYLILFLITLLSTLIISSATSLSTSIWLYIYVFGWFFLSMMIYMIDIERKFSAISVLGFGFIVIGFIFPVFYTLYLLI